MTYDTPVKALGMCLIESDRFSTRQGWGYVQVRGSTYPGREHWASAKLPDGDMADASIEVRDGTLRQFNPEARVVWKGDLEDWLDDMSDYLNDSLRWAIFKNFQDEQALCWGEINRDDLEEEGE
jgi:hypothetical protein